MFGLSALPTDSFYKFSLFSGIAIVALTFYLTWDLKQTQINERLALDSTIVIKKYNLLRFNYLKKLTKLEQQGFKRDSLINQQIKVAEQISLEEAKIKQLNRSIPFMERLTFPAFVILTSGFIFFIIGVVRWMKMQTKNDDILEVQRQNTILECKKLELELEILKTQLPSTDGEQQ